jgi:hypothetical protein
MAMIWLKSQLAATFSFSTVERPNEMLLKAGVTDTVTALVRPFYDRNRGHFIAKVT